MSIRLKLLLLLLAIALVPLMTVTMRANRATEDLGEVLGDRARRTLTQLTRQHLEQLVRDRATIIGREANVVSLAVQLQAREVERALAVESPEARTTYMAQDFDGERPPSDLELSTRHLRILRSGRSLPIPISTSEVVFKIAPAMLRTSMRQDMWRLALAVPTYRALQERYGDLLYWNYTSLGNGIHSCYPGHGGYPLDFDPRQRRWYVRASQSEQVVWTLPYTDTTSGQAVMTAAMPVHRPDGTLAGVTAIDTTVAGLLERARLPRFSGSTAKIVALVPPDWDVTTHGELDLSGYAPDQLSMLVVAEQFEAHSEGLWGSPPTRTRLEPDASAESEQVLRDMYQGRSSVREVSFQGRPFMWAYSPILGGRAFLLVMLPQAEVVAEAVRAKESVLSLTHGQSRVTAAMLAVVAVGVLAIALASSRTVTRPVSQLVQAAQRVAEGDFSTRVRVRARDELGELARAFNRMVPQLHDRIRMRQSLALAMEVQQNLLPAKAPDIPGLDVAGRSIYCDETGGDYYDFIESSQAGPGELGLAVGDVAGHGVAAALLMTTARALLRSRAAENRSLAELMQVVNRLLVEDAPPGRYMTLFYAVIDAERRSVRWANAGHDPAITYDPNADRFDVLDGGDLPLGIEPDESYQEFRLEGLVPEQVIVIGTDGIWETRNWQGEPFGKDALRQAIRDSAAGSAEQIIQCITDALDRFRQGRPQDDDVTLVVVKQASTGQSV